MDLLRRAWRWLFTIAPAERYFLTACMTDGSVLYIFEKRTKREAIRFMNSCVDGGLVDDTDYGFRWIPADKIERIFATRINPNG